MDQGDLERILGNAQPKDDGASVLRRFQASLDKTAPATTKPVASPVLLLFAIAAAACILVLLPMYFFNTDGTDTHRASQDEPTAHGPANAPTFLANVWRTGFFGYAQHRDGREQRAALFAVHAEDGKHALNKYDLASGHLLWSAPLPALYESAITLAGGRALVGGTDGHLRSFDAMTGAQLWEFNAGGTVHGAACVVKNTVYFGSISGNLYCVDAASGEERWRITFENAIWNTPAWDRNRVYFSTHDGIFHCVDAVHGAVQWNTAIESGYYGSCLVVGNKVYTGSDTGKVYCMDAMSGDLLWQQQVNTLPAKLVWWSSLTFDGQHLLAGGFDGTLYAFDPATGNELWRLAGDSLLHCTASTADGLIVQNIDGYLRAITSSGVAQWTLTDPATKANISCSPALFEDKIYVNSFSGELLVFDLHTGKLCERRALCPIGRSSLVIAR